ncbi:MAG: sensor histidine kinase, partial [Acutalibacteraceae bacterium]
FETYFDEGYYATTNKNGAKLTEELYNEHRKELDSLKCDALVEINNAYYGSDYYSGVYGKHYSGIYEVFINEENVDIYNPDVFYSDGLEFTADENSFSDEYNKMDSLLSGYKNVFFAVLDEETGEFYTNFSSPETKKITADNVGELMSDFCKNNYYKYTTKTDYVWDNSFQCYTMQEADYIRSRLPEDLNFTLWVGYDETLSGGDDAFSQPDETREKVVENFKKYAPPTAVCALGWIICLIALIFMSGRKSYDDELHMGRFDGIFTEIKTVLNLGLIALAIWAAYVMIYNNDTYIETGVHNFSPGVSLIVYALCGISSLLLLDWVLYLSRHIKNRTLLKNISVVRLIIFIRRKVKERKEKRLSKTPEYVDFRKKLLRVTVPVLVVGNIILLILIMFLSDYDEAFLLLLPIIAAAEFFIIRYGMRWVMGIKLILDAIHGMREGKADVYADTGKMPSSLKPYANDVNSVSEGLSIAVEKATKEQRTRTELITNVSHDLKTPLTSIINYVDLLSKRPIEDEEAKKYVAVLGEKSEKLKKLIEDLVEASKASAGNVSVNLVRMSLHELISQITGEYEDDFSKKGLTVFIEEKSGDITVSADSKLASRVLDNLMVNIRKYAMPGTRVYIRLFADGEYGCIGISNISEQQLNIPASELKERFVRGDKSRSTEGSGLGLAIAEDFMSLQNGKLDLFINGDMFTAVISFRIIPTQEEKN